MVHRLLSLLPIAITIPIAGCGLSDSDLGGSSAPAETAAGWCFEDVTASSGIDFRCTFGDEEFSYILEDTGSGVATFDYDGDGLLDLYFVNGTWLEGINDPAGRPNNLLPFVTQVAVGRRPHLTVFGDDYPTPDGTCVRDYIHVEDLATAHIAALRALLSGWSGAPVNLGSGGGHSVLEVLEAVRAVAGGGPITVEPRRAGDPPTLVADTRRARDLLGWAPRHTLAEMVEDAWKWHRSPDRPAGTH